MLLPSEKLLELAQHRFKSAEKKRLYGKYIENLSNKGLPVILSFRHLADALELTPSELQGLTFSTHQYYREFTVPKRSGGSRTISSPSPLLDKAQTWILNNILNVVHENNPEGVIGYSRGRSILDHITPHASSVQLVKFDLKDFFPSLGSEKIRTIFGKMGYSRSATNTLASLSTLNDGLPQGARTSPALSNIHMRDFDFDMNFFCRENSLIYSRYVDDIVVSGDDIFALLPKIKTKFSDHSLNINHKKTRAYRHLDQVRFITGLILHNGKIRLPKEMRRRIRVQCHLFLRDIDHFVSHGASNMNLSPPISWKEKEAIFDPTFPDRLIGKLNYWLHIEPSNSYAINALATIKEKLSSI
ncbi:reverse transcriptase family protein [Achromobacter spanius]